MITELIKIYLILCITGTIGAIFWKICEYPTELHTLKDRRVLKDFLVSCLIEGCLPIIQIILSVITVFTVPFAVRILYKNW